MCDFKQYKFSVCQDVFLAIAINSSSVFTRWLSQHPLTFLIIMSPTFEARKHVENTSIDQWATSMCGEWSVGLY